MKKFLKLTFSVIVIIVVLAMFVKLIDYNSLGSKNTRYLEKNLSENVKITNGNVKDLITFDYDKMYVFESYQSIEEMERQIGFKYHKLKQGVSEGMLNILFVKDNRAIAYLYGYPSNIGYYINIQSGEYNKADIDYMTYTVEEREVGNSSGSPRTYMHYEFIA